MASPLAGVDKDSVEVAFGRLLVAVTGVRSASGLSSTLPAANYTVGGTWGIPSPPVLLSVIAVDSGHNPGVGTNDSVVAVFDQNVTALDVGNTTAVERLLSFSPPLATIASTYSLSGQWLNTSALRVVFTLPSGVVNAAAAAVSWRVGSLFVTINPGANLRGVGSVSDAANCTALVSGGSWGDVPAAALAVQSSTAFAVTLTPPGTSVGFPVTTYVVQWNAAWSFNSSVPLANATAVLALVAATGNGSGNASNAARAYVTNSGVTGTVYRVDVNGTLRGTAVIVLTTPVSTPFTVTVSGVGANTPYSVRVCCNSNVPGQFGPIALADNGPITLAPPAITAVVPPSGGLVTNGGSPVVITGLQIGGVDASVTMALSNGRYTFTSASCSIVTPAVVVSCAAPPGVGSNHSVTLTVDGQPSARYTDTLLSYATPTLLSLSYAAGVALDSGGGAVTAGGAVVTLTGVNFGPVALSPASITSVTYSPAGLPTTVFVARNCTVTVDHVGVTCVMVAGVGDKLSWSVTIAGVSSTSPRTSYAAPAIAAVGVVTANGSVSFAKDDLGRLRTAGGDTLVFRGNHFGAVDGGFPRTATGVSPQPLAAMTGGGVTTLCTVPATAPYVELRCVCPAGVGVGFVWTVSVAGQSSLPLAAVTSFAAPVVTAIVVTSAMTVVPLYNGLPAVPTAGNAVVTLSGVDFGAIATAVVVMWGNDSVPVAVAVPHSTLTFTAPAGEGPPVNVSVSVAGQSATWLGGGLTQLFGFSPPAVRGMALLRVVYNTSLDCSVVTADGSPLHSSASVSAANTATVVLTGDNFGAGPQTSVTVGGTPAALLSVSHVRIVFQTGKCFGACPD